MEKSEVIQGISSPKKAKIENVSEDEDDNLSYEQLREKRLKENMNMLKTLGVTEAAETLADSIKKYSQIKNLTLTKKVSSQISSKPTRRSMRLANIPAPEVDLSKNLDFLQNNDNIRRSMRLADIPASEVNLSTNLDFPQNIKKNKDSITIPEEDSEFFEKLNSNLVIKEAVNDFHTCDFDRFTQVLKSLELNEPTLKVTERRICSLAVHPSETSLIIAAGDVKGNLALCNNNDLSTQKCRIHDAPINCISFCSWDPFKLFSTSHDGSVRCGDITKRTFDIIYSSNLWADKQHKDINYTHTTWHTEYERNLLVGIGSGLVDLIDTRKPNEVQQTAWCHERSVRTVQCHPIEKHYFLTSSGLGEVSLFDIRYMTDKTIKPVLQFKHSKSLTSAFFSASGTNIVSTCNDDFIRIFNTSKLSIEATEPTKKISHNNHAGRWLSVFKAKWNPGRDDAFFVCSMQVPKRVQIYSPNGNVLHNLLTMSTYCPVIEVHPTQAIYVGGNASGNLHIFSTKQQLI